MKTKSHIFILLLSLIAFFVILSYSVKACSIPVYQYALERWSADKYEVLIFYRGVLAPQEQAKVDKLQEASSNDKLSSNIIIKTIDLDDPANAPMQKILESQRENELPFVMVKYPRLSNVIGNAYVGRLESLNIDALINSPARKEIANHIIKGNIAVWVFLESGDAQQDKEKFDLLETQLKKMSETLKIMALGSSGQPEVIDRKATFSILKLSKNEPRESFFIQMLLNSEPDLKKLSKPLAFPIFARGRLLYALVGNGINEENIEESCKFLVGWCSCEIKELNPGVDILMSVNWDKALSGNLGEEKQVDTDNVDKNKKNQASETTPKIELSKSVNSKKFDSKELNEKVRQINSESERIEITKSESNLMQNILIASFVLIFGVAGATGFILWKKKQNS